MKTLFSRRDLFAVFASVFLCVFMVGVITYGATMTISSSGIGSGTSTPGAAVAAQGAAIFEGFVSANYFTSTSSLNSWLMGNLGLGTTTPGAKLSVRGGALVDDFVMMSYFTATSTTATSTIQFGLEIATTSLFVDGNSGAVTIGTSTVPNADVAGTMSVDPSFTVSGVGSAYQATGTVYVAGGGTTGGQIILKSSNGLNCVSIMAGTGANAVGAEAMIATSLLDVDVVECPR